MNIFRMKACCENNQFTSFLSIENTTDFLVIAIKEKKKGDIGNFDLTKMVVNLASLILLPYIACSSLTIGRAI